MSHLLKDKLKHIFSRMRRAGLNQQRFTKRSALLRYSVAAFAVAVALLIKLLLEPLIVQETPFLLIFVAILFSAWYGGLGPGLAATAGAALIIDYFFLPPLYSLTVFAFDINGVPLGAFVLEGVLFSLIVTALRSAQHRAEANALEAQRRQEDLRQSEERYRAVVEQAAEGICLIDANSKRVLESNPEFQRMLGYTPEEVAGLSIYDFITHDRENVDRNFQLTLEKGRHAVGERRYRRKDGSLIDVMAGGSAIYYSGRKVASLVIRDITDRKRYEEALRATQERFRLLVEGVEDYAIFMLDPDGYVVSWNVGAERIKGYRAEEIIGKHCSVFYPEQDVKRGEPEREFKVAEDEGAYEDEALRVRKDGSTFWASVLTTVLKDEEGNLRGFSKVTRDITERKRAEEALQASLKELADLKFAIDESTIVAFTDQRGKITYVNERFLEISKYSKEELLGQDHRIINSGYHPKEYIRDLWRTIAQGRVWRGELRNRAKDGSIYWEDTTIVPFLDERSKPYRYVAIRHDITSRKETEQRLQDTLDRLLALYEASQILGSTLESEEVVSRLLEIMRRVSHLTAAVISVQEEEEDDDDDDDGREPDGRKPDGRERVWRSVGLERLSQGARHAPEAVDARRAALETEEYQLFRLQSLDAGTEHLVGLCLPLLIRDRSLGVLEAYGSKSLAESEAVEVLGSLAGQAASALENARLYGELADREQRLQDLVEKMLATQEEERRRVAYEVHDGLAQIAVAAHTYLNAFARQHTSEDIRGREKLDRALELIEQTVEEARRVIADLRPTALDDFGLAAALRLYVEELRSEDCETSYEEALGDERLPVPVETALYRVAQEALTNVRKHADSSRVHINLERMDEGVRLEVRDWGRGFELGKGTAKGGPGERVGLVGMQERIALLGGDLKVHSQPGAGTSVVAEVPLYEDTPGEDNGHHER